MPPLWRVAVGPNGATYYGPQDGRYGTEAALRDDYELRGTRGESVRLEHRETVGAEWQVIESSDPLPALGVSAGAKMQRVMF